MPAALRRIRNRKAVDPAVRLPHQVRHMHACRHAHPAARHRQHAAVAVAALRPCVPGSRRSLPDPLAPTRRGARRRQAAEPAPSRVPARKPLASIVLALGGSVGTGARCARGGGPSCAVLQKFVQPPKLSAASSAALTATRGWVWTIVKLPGWMTHLRTACRWRTRAMPHFSGEICSLLYCGFAATRRMPACIGACRHP